MLYESNGCASCHGRDGHGDGPVAHTLDARPTDFRYPQMFTRGATEEAIVKTLVDGVAIHKVSAELKTSHHELVMPRFNHLEERELHSLALYVISLRNGNDGKEADHKEVQP